MWFPIVTNREPRKSGGEELAQPSLERKSSTNKRWRIGYVGRSWNCLNYSTRKRIGRITDWEIEHIGFREIRRPILSRCSSRFRFGHSRGL